MKSMRNFTSVGDLVLAQVDVAVVLRKLPHAREAGERTRQFVAVQHVEGHEAHRQLAIRVLLRSRNRRDATDSSSA
jgi:hypothetical protein